MKRTAASSSPVGAGRPPAPDEEQDLALELAAPPRARERDYTVRAVDRVCAILDRLQESLEGASLNDLADAADMPKSSMFRYLWTLEAHRYVERDPDTQLYRLGLGFAGMQSRQLEVLRHHTRPWMLKLRDEFGETVNLGVWDGGSIIYLDIMESQRGVRLAARPGDRDPLHATALGKAIAAHLPEDRVRDALGQTGMPARTANTITTLDSYLDELIRVRRVGYALDNGENEIDGRCVAVPILGTRLPAALSLSAPISRFPLQDVDKVAAALQHAAEAIASTDTTAEAEAAG